MGRRAASSQPRRGRRVVAAAGAVALVAALAPQPSSAAWNAAGSGSGRAAAVTLAAPATVESSCLAGLQIGVAWRPVPNATSYTIERTSALGSWQPVATARGITEWIDAGLSNLLGLTIRWRVRAHVHGWSSPVSAPSATRTLTVLGACL